MVVGRLVFISDSLRLESEYTSNGGEYVVDRDNTRDDFSVRGSLCSGLPSSTASKGSRMSGLESTSPLHQSILAISLFCTSRRLLAGPTSLSRSHLASLGYQDILFKDSEDALALR